MKARIIANILCHTYESGMSYMLMSQVTHMYELKMPMVSPVQKMAKMSCYRYACMHIMMQRRYKCIYIYVYVCLCVRIYECMYLCMFVCMNV